MENKFRFLPDCLQDKNLLVWKDFFFPQKSYNIRISLKSRHICNIASFMPYGSLIYIFRKSWNIIFFFYRPKSTSWRQNQLKYVVLIFVRTYETSSKHTYRYIYYMFLIYRHIMRWNLWRDDDNRFSCWRRYFPRDIIKHHWRYDYNINLWHWGQFMSLETEFIDFP